jgi:hypothetical protein
MPRAVFVACDVPQALTFLTFSKVIPELSMDVFAHV